MEDQKKIGVREIFIEMLRLSGDTLSKSNIPQSEIQKIVEQAVLADKLLKQAES